MPVEEHLVYESHVYPAASTSELLKTATRLNQTGSTPRNADYALKRIETSSHKEFKDPVLNAVVSLAHETARAGYGALVFAGSRGMCETDAKLIARVMPQQAEVDPAIMEKRIDLLAELRSLNIGIDPSLEQTIPSGVAFHREFSAISPG